jgi:hypothetical protein
MDQGVPAVFVCTPQSYLPARRRFVNPTGFAMEQFDERILKSVHLPEELCEADLLAVARIHFSELADEYLQFVVNTALATKRNFVSDIKKIATLAKDSAREHGRKLQHSPTLKLLSPMFCQLRRPRSTIYQDRLDLLDQFKGFAKLMQMGTNPQALILKTFRNLAVKRDLCC